MTSDLRAVVSNPLGEPIIENGQVLVRVNTDENRSADLREDLAFLFEAFGYVM